MILLIILHVLAILISTEIRAIFSILNDECFFNKKIYFLMLMIPGYFYIYMFIKIFKLALKGK